MTAAALEWQPGAVASEEPKLRAALAALSRRRVFIGHQSVGMNVLDGMRALALESGAPLRIVEVTATDRPTDGAVLHGYLAENGRPDLKLESFARMFRAGPALGAELALFKFCYADFDASTDVRALFSRYQAMIADLRRVSPSTTFIHVTAPLTTVQGGPRALIKRLLGRTPYGIEENARRAEYNALLRAAYSGKEPFFDLAAIESTGLDGSAATFEWRGRRVPALADEYTDDGGHLNGLGSRRGARALITLLDGISGAQSAAH
ncbi:MAG: hypothetical protein WCC48_09715 [Anaeromyxobacteraceae bacterium]